MAISEAMFAKALAAYLREHEQEFEIFLRNLYPDDLEDWEVHGLKEDERILLLRMKKRSDADGSTLAEHDYSITIKKT